MKMTAAKVAAMRGAVQAFIGSGRGSGNGG
jgi:hypothetical protein